MSCEERRLREMLQTLERIERKLDELPCLRGRKCPVKEDFKSTENSSMKTMQKISE